MVKKILLGLCLFVASICFVTPVCYESAITLAEEEIPGEETPPVDTPTTEYTSEQLEIIRGYETGYTISVSTHLTDTNLYSSLLDAFEKWLKNTHGITYDAQTIYRDMFKDFTDLTFDDSLILSLEGLELINFANLKSLNITRNKLTTINKEIFAKMPVIENLDFTANEITSVDLGKISTLKSINLSNNKLSELNLKDLGASTININVAQNNFEDISMIKFPERVNEISLNIINNKISEIPEDYLKLSKLKMSIGVQGINVGSEVISDTTIPLRYYKTNIDNLKLRIYRYNGIIDEPIEIIGDNDIPANAYYLDKYLPIGQYVFEYVFDRGNDVFEPALDSEDITRSFYETGKMTVLPATCTITYEFKGEKYETFTKKVTGKVKVFLSSVEGSKIMYKVNSGEWIECEGNYCEITCDEGGNYTIYSKVIIDGMESKEKVVLVRTSQNVIIPDIVMLVLVLLFTLALFMIVVPLVSKKFFRK